MDMEADINEFKIEKIVSGRDLEGSFMSTILKDGYACKVALADYVSSEEGTGLRRYRLRPRPGRLLDRIKI